MDQPVAKALRRKAISWGTISWGTVALIVPLIAILVAAGWLAARTWLATEGSPISTNGYVAMTLGIVFSLVVGCGLMALLFYSNRHGYDEIGSQTYAEKSTPDQH